MKQYELIIFDLDGVLAESKSAITEEMAGALVRLLGKYSVAIISGGGYEQFQKQVVSKLHCSDDLLKKLYLFPTCGTSFYRFNEEWHQIYSIELDKGQKARIYGALISCFNKVSWKIPSIVFGEMVEDRGTQITYSALGQKAPVEIKKDWDPDRKKRLEMISYLAPQIPEFEVRVGGSTSIDITRKGLDKAFGIHQMEKHLGASKDKMLFIGDSLFEGGNDAPVRTTGVDCIEVIDPSDTMNEINRLLGK